MSYTPDLGKITIDGADFLKLWEKPYFVVQPRLENCRYIEIA